MGKRVCILGTRGIPACHGGFETFTEKLAPYLASQGWDVSVYCQEFGESSIKKEIWNNVELVKFAIPSKGSLGSVIFDWKSVLHASGRNTIVLTMGYNTAIFSFIYKLRGVAQIMNMDGIEWRRPKWSFPLKLWFRINERLGCWLADHLIADHPVILNHLSSRAKNNKISMIPYGADEPVEDAVPAEGVHALDGKEFCLIIARPEPENSILEIVRAFSRVKRHLKLVVLGEFEPEANSYHREVMGYASDEVLFLGSIYDNKQVSYLRHNARLYIHGHSVGGTNPSLVEAMAAKLPILSRRNDFNRWVMGDDAEYFTDEEECATKIDLLLKNEAKRIEMSRLAYDRYLNSFSWESPLSAYNKLLASFVRK